MIMNMRKRLLERTTVGEVLDGETDRNGTAYAMEVLDDQKAINIAELRSSPCIECDATDQLLESLGRTRSDIMFDERGEYVLVEDESDHSDTYQFDLKKRYLHE